ncbi:MAG: geranylgeranyl reductase family protein [Anaerolineae bacterium]|nr:geranylgeranyl reductase family protein [Anaerolineae bacterium]
MAARSLALEGHQVLLLEREALPRYKACGGGLSPKSVARLPFPVEDIPHHRITHVSFRLRGTMPVTWPLPKGTPFYSVMRSDLDYALVRSAVVVGAYLREQAEVTAVYQHGDGHLVQTNAGQFRAPYVVAADGATGPLRRLLGFRYPPQRGVAIECELTVSPEVLERYAGTLVFDVEAVKGGYAWIFPKADHLSVGAGSMHRPGTSLRQRLWSFILENDLVPEADLEELHTYVHPLPLSNLGDPCRKGGVLLAGDAAGLADGLAGEGICYALDNGDLAGRLIAEALQGNPAALDRYDAELDRMVRRDQRYARVIGDIVRRFPDTCYRLFTGIGEERRTLTALLVGQLAFAEFLMNLPVLRTLGQM